VGALNGGRACTTEALKTSKLSRAARTEIAHRYCWRRCCTTAACPGMRLTITAAGEPAPFKHAPSGPSLRSKRGVEPFRRTDDTYARPIRRRGAPMSPTGAAITLEALSTGLRQCLSESTNPVTVGLAGRCRRVAAGTSYRSPPDVSGRLGSQPRLRIPQGVRRTRELRNAVGARAHSRSVSAHRRGSQSKDLCDMRAIPTCSSAGHMAAPRRTCASSAIISAIVTRPKGGRAG
jgi:hypothetical protein